MVWEGVPWFVNAGGHTPEVARVLAYAAMGGREGVIGPNDLKVRASNIPDGNVNIQPGAAAMLNRYGGGGNQGYISRNVGNEAVALSPQGSSGVRYDLIAVVVQDPQYAGQPAPPSVPNGPYVVTKVYQNVNANVRSLAEVAANQTGYALALVKFDPSDGTVTQSDITDLRGTLFARSLVVEKVVSIRAGTSNIPGNLGVFPPGASWSIDVPPWATHVNLSAVISGVDCLDLGQDGGTAKGVAVVELGALTTDTANWRVNAVGPGKSVTHTFQAAQGDIALGTMSGNQTLRVRASATESGMVARSNDGTTAVVRATFLEKVL